MLKKRLFKYLFPALVVSLAGLLIHDYYDSFDVPRFRRMDVPFKRTAEGPLPSRQGLETLHVSGSKRPSPGGLRQLLQDVDMPVYVFDMQCEPHYFINGSPQSWYGYRWDGEVGIDRPEVGFRHYVRRLLYSGKLHHKPQDVMSEQDVMKEFGFNYLAIAVSRGTIPTAKQVDEFIHILNSLPQPSWVHFHCYNGGGRTSISIIMVDILKNGRDLSVEEICKRQYLLGSENMFNTDVWKHGTYKKDQLERRRDFIIAFHRFVNDPQGYGHSSFEDWSTRHEVYKKWNLGE